jgi:methylmalonyl-CoA/ethylmalonyl-CoA epimerase
MLTQIDHIGILVDDIGDNTALFEVLGLPVGGIERVEEFGVDIAFIRVGESLVELIEPLNKASPIAKEIDAADTPAFIHHVAFRVDDIEAELGALAAQGIPLADERPRPGAGDARVAFLEARAGNGVRIELVERPHEVTFD